MVAEILKRNGESVSGAKLASSSPGVKTVGLLQAGHEPCARRVGARAKTASRAMVKYCIGLLLHKAAVKGEYDLPCIYPGVVKPAIFFGLPNNP